MDGQCRGCSPCASRTAASPLSTTTGVQPCCRLNTFEAAPQLQAKVEVFGKAGPRQAVGPASWRWPLVPLGPSPAASNCRTLSSLVSPGVHPPSFEALKLDETILLTDPARTVQASQNGQQAKLASYFTGEKPRFTEGEQGGPRSHGGKDLNRSLCLSTLNSPDLNRAHDQTSPPFSR